MLVAKSSKFWSDLLLITSIVCVIFMFLSLIDTRQEWFSTRDAATYMRYGVLAGVVLMASSFILIYLVRDNIQSLVKSFSALTITTISLLIIKAYLPIGTNLFIQKTPVISALRPDVSHPPLALALVSIKELATESIQEPEHTLPYRAEKQKVTKPIKAKHNSIATEMATHFSEINAINSSISE